MSLSRRNVMHFAAGVAAVAALPGVAKAQSYPTRTITLLVSFPAGGAADAMGRLVAERTQEPLGQSVVVENVPGAGGSLGLGRLARAAADGYTLGMGTFTTHVINALGQLFFIKIASKNSHSRVHSATSISGLGRRVAFPTSIGPMLPQYRSPLRDT